MSDAFVLLSEVRRPWLDTDALKARFVAFSREVHPDRVHGAGAVEKEEANRRYAELNAAYSQLREARERLLHLYQLEAGQPPQDIQRIPPGTMDLFVEIGQACRDCDTYLTGRTVSTSPMLKLKQFQEGIVWTEKLQSLQSQVNARREALNTELQAMNAIWEAAPAVGAADRRAALPLDRLEQIYRSLSYVARWTEQLQERIVRLAV